MSRFMTNQQNDLCAQRRLRSAWASTKCAQWVAKDPSFLHADSEDSDQTGRMPGLMWVFAGRTCHFFGFVMRRLICLSESHCWCLYLSPHFLMIMCLSLRFPYIRNFRCSFSQYVRPARLKFVYTYTMGRWIIYSRIWLLKSTRHFIWLLVFLLTVRELAQSIDWRWTGNDEPIQSVPLSALDTIL